MSLNPYRKYRGTHGISILGDALVLVKPRPQGAQDVLKKQAANLQQLINYRCRSQARVQALLGARAILIGLNLRRHRFDARGGFKLLT
jgi:hypothetical protein